MPKMPSRKFDMRLLSKRRSRVMKDMAFVYNNPPESDKTGGQKLCRKLLEKDPAGFVSKLAAMDAALMARKAKQDEHIVAYQQRFGAPGDDEGAALVKEQLEEEWREIGKLMPKEK